MVRKYYDMNAILGGGGGTGLGQYSASYGSLSGNSVDTPYTLGEATVKPKATKAGFDWLGLSNSVLSNAGGIIGALNGNGTPQNVTNNYNTTGNDSNNKGGNTMLFVALGVAALVIAILIFKK